MNRKAFFLMALLLAAATAATAATALAGPGKKKLFLVNKEVAAAIHESADTTQRVKVHRRRVLRQTPNVTKPNTLR
jgi:hypothetical protein